MAEAAAVHPKVDEWTKLDTKTRICYAFGDAACNCSWTMVSNYLTFFFTDMAMIPAGLVGTVILISKAWDAINDPIIGGLSDRTKSRWGRYRPWILFSFLPMLIFNVLCFSTNLNWSVTMRAVWGLGMYFILVLLYTMVNVTYSALPTVMTRDTETRGSLAAWRMTFTFILGTILGFTVLRVVNAFGNNAAAYTKTTIIFSVLAIPMFLICVFGTKEIVEIPYEKTPIMAQFSLLKKNKPVWCLIGAFLGWGIMNGGMTFKMYYFTYFVGDQIRFANVNTLIPIFAAFGTFSLNWLVTKVKNKATPPMLGFFIYGITCVICYFLPMRGIGADGGRSAMMMYYVFGGAIQGFCTGLILGALFGMVPDTAEYTMYKYGKYAGGFISTVVNFFFKVGQAVSISAAAWVLEGIGYVAGGTQTESVLWHMNFWSHIFVAICMFFSAFCLFLYKLDKKIYKEMAEEIEAGRYGENAVKDFGI